MNFCLSQEIKLDKGFQLVSHVFESVELSTQNLGSNLIVFWGFDTSKEKYLFHTNDPATKSKLLSLSFEELTYLAKNTAYYCFSDKDTSITLNSNTLSSPVQSIQFSKSNELRYLSSPLGFSVHDLGTAYHSIWTMKGKFWSVYSPDPQIQNQYQTLLPLREILANEPFIIISKNASLIQFPQYKFPQHYGMQLGLATTAQESYGYTWSTTGARVKILDSSDLSSTQDSMIDWLVSKKIQHLLINPMPKLNDHYLNFVELNTIGLTPPNDTSSLCQFITKLNSKGVTPGLDLSQLTQLNSDNFRNLDFTSGLSSKLSTDSYLSIIKSFESSTCLAQYIYSQSLDSNLQSIIQTQTQLALFSPDSQIHKSQQISNLISSTAYSSKGTYPLIFLNGNDLTKNSKEALIYARYKSNPIFLYSSTPTLSLTKDFQLFNDFNFSFVQDLNSKYSTNVSTKTANILLLGQSKQTLKQEQNLSNISSILHSLGYNITITNQNYITADLYYIIHFSDMNTEDLNPLLALDKPKFWQESSSPMHISTIALSHFQMSKSSFDLVASPNTFNYQSTAFTLAKSSSNSFVITPQDISSNASSIVDSSDGSIYLFLKDKLYFVNTDLIDLEFGFVLRHLLDSDGITTVHKHNYTISDPPIILSNATQNISLKVSKVYTKLSILQNFHSLTNSTAPSQTLSLIDQNLYLFSKNYTPISTIQKTYTFSGSQKAIIPSTNIDLDLDPLTFLWTQTGGDALTIDDPKSPILRVQLPSKAESVQKFNFNLQSYDGVEYSSPVSTQIEIAANSAPIIETNANFSFSGNTAITISPVITDPNSDSLSYLWSQISGPSVAIENINTNQLKFTSPVKTNSIQNLVFQIAASDSWITTTKQITVNVLANKVPSVFVPSNIQSSLSSFPFTFQASASDPEKDSLNYTWRVISPNNLDINIHNGLNQSQLAITTPTVSDTTDIIVGVKVFDGLIFSNEKTITLRVEVCRLDICN
ncbi:MAG: hypothetical protein KC646_05660 [Candidatus Cloacimonetes bacterium]|nr:hypothetical protein [Candidatus Cloacimonadota bacterium]